MKNQDRAAKVISDVIRSGLRIPEEPGYSIARKLYEENLITQDLPEPDLDAHDPEWQSEYKENYECQAPDVWYAGLRFNVAAFHQDCDVTIWDDEEPLEPLSIEEARKFAHSLLAAARRQEQVNNERRACRDAHQLRSNATELPR